MKTDTGLELENLYLRADVAVWQREADQMRKARNGWRSAFCAALLIGTIAGVVLGFAIAQGVL